MAICKASLDPWAGQPTSGQVRWKCLMPCEHVKCPSCPRANPLAPSRPGTCSGDAHGIGKGGRLAGGGAAPSLNGPRPAGEKIVVWVLQSAATARNQMDVAASGPGRRWGWWWGSGLREGLGRGLTWPSEVWPEVPPPGPRGGAGQGGGARPPLHPPCGHLNPPPASQHASSQNTGPCLLGSLFVHSLIPSLAPSFL